MLQRYVSTVETNTNTGSTGYPIHLEEEREVMADSFGSNLNARSP